MIQRAEKARGSKKVKNMADCLTTENSWILSENFDRDCKERCQIKLNHNEHLRFSIDMWAPLEYEDENDDSNDNKDT